MEIILVLIFAALFAGIAGILAGHVILWIALAIFGL
jgi:hypothetical protein